mgnify:CR=1
ELLLNERTITGDILYNIPIEYT